MVRPVFTALVRCSFKLVHPNHCGYHPFRTLSTKLDKVLYTANTHTTGGRNGSSKSDDGRLLLDLSMPGGPGKGTNPEQLFAAGYSACFIGAIGAVGGKRRVAMPSEGPSVDASVDLGSAGEGFGIAVRLTVHIPRMDLALAKEICDEAHQICPYSTATRNNIDVTITVK